jgi:hypothetical protein
LPVLVFPSIILKYLISVACIWQLRMGEKSSQLYVKMYFLLCMFGFVFLVVCFKKFWFNIWQSLTAS